MVYNKGGKYKKSNKAWQSVMRREESKLTWPAYGVAGTPVELCQYVKLAANSGDAATPTPSILKVKNFKCQIQLEASLEYYSSVMLAICYLPQGYTVTPNTITYHPEWLMGWKMVDMKQTSTSSVPSLNTAKASASFSSRLSRNLKSGDGVALLISAQWNHAENPGYLVCNHSVSYVCCTN